MTRETYAGEDVLSLDRMKRAVSRRVTEIAGRAFEQGGALDRTRLAALVDEEWKAAMETARSSPLVRERARERMLRNIAELIDNHVNADQAELETLGVSDKHP